MFIFGVCFLSFFFLIICSRMMTCDKGPIPNSNEGRKDASVHPFEDYIWLWDHFFRGKWRLFIRKIKAMQCFRLTLINWNMHVKVLRRLGVYEMWLLYLYQSWDRKCLFICAWINWRWVCFLVSDTPMITFLLVYWCSILTLQSPFTLIM